MTKCNVLANRSVQYSKSRAADCLLMLSFRLATCTSSADGCLDVSDLMMLLCALSLA